MKKKILACLIAICSLHISCEKENIQREKLENVPLKVSENRFRDFRPLRPIPLINAEITSICISSYEDLVSYLGTNSVTITSVILESGITIMPIPEDVGNITYTAIEGKTGSSIFSSYLSAKWRPTLYEDWRGFTSHVWTQGCSFPDSGAVFYTNLIKNNIKILINTSLTWNVGEYAGQNIRFLIIN